MYFHRTNIFIQYNDKTVLQKLAQVSISILFSPGNTFLFKNKFITFMSFHFTYRQLQ